MTIAHDPALCFRLIANGRAQIDDFDKYGTGLGPVVLRGLADQLEAACAKVDILTHEVDVQSHHAALNIAMSEETISTITAERDSLRRQLETACKEVVERDDLVGRITARVERDAATARVAELESALKGAEQEVSDVREQVAPREAQERIVTLQIQVDGLRNTLRAILPVYRAADLPIDDDRPGVLVLRLRGALHDSRSAITPEIAAVLAEMETK